MYAVRQAMAAPTAETPAPAEGTGAPPTPGSTPDAGTPPATTATHTVD
jgi:hypothetical protein